MPRPKQAQKSNLSEEIKATAWRLIALEGASSLSLRAIARELKITAPAIYNYYPRRDDLVTQLVVDAFTSFGDAQHAALASIDPQDHAGRLRQLGLAYRQWALDYPERYQLIFGAPIPGYLAPQELVMPAGARALSALVRVIEALRLAGRLHAPDFPPITPGYEPLVAVWKSYGGQADDLSLSVAILIWCRVHGLVSLEIGGSLPPFGEDGAALYRYELEWIGKQFVRP
jgi:AcrR family transcriptional regulator